METSPEIQRARTAASGSVVLAFLNTRSGPPDGGGFDRELLDGYAAFAEWCAHAGVLDDATANGLRRTSSRYGDAGAAAFSSALALRDDLDTIMRSREKRQPAPRAELDRLRDRESEALAHGSLVSDEHSPELAWQWTHDLSLQRPGRELVHAATVLLVAGPLERLKQCAGCSFIFLDESKNRSRRWCSMAGCGTAAKMRRYVAARRERAGASHE